MSRPAMRVASAPVSFGVDEIMMDDAWMPAPDDMLDWMVDIGFEGTELGPPGFLGDAAQVHERLSSRGLEFVGSFLPQHFSRAEQADDDRAWLRDQLRLVRKGSPSGSQPFAILSDQFDEPDRMAFSGRIAEHPETWLSAARFDTLIDNLHRAAELCRAEGLEPVLHPHAGNVRRDGRRDRPGHGPDRPVAHRAVPRHRPLPLRRRGSGQGGQRLPRAHPARPHQGLQRAIMDGVRAEGKGLEEALRRGVFCPLGQGDAGIAEVIDALRAQGYTGLARHRAGSVPASSDTPASVVAGQRANREYLRGLGI